MWYDLLVLAILGFFALRGAARGLISQLAGIAAIFVCLAFAESISAAFGPYVKLEPPLNHWVVMVGAYLVCSFIAFGFARVMDDWLERAKLESFNQHLGAVFGLAKGVVLCMVMTFFLATLSPAARDALSRSRSAYAAAYIMHGIHPVMPEKIQEALARYLHVYESTAAGAPLQADGPGQPATTPPANGSGTPGFGTPWTPDTPLPPVAPTAPSAIDQFLAVLPASLNPELKSLIGRSLANTPPAQRDQAQQQLWNLLRQTRPEDLWDLQQQLARNGQLNLGDALAGWASGYRPPSSSVPTPSNPPPGNPSPWQPAPATQPAPAPQPQGQPPTQPPAQASPATSRQDQLLAEVSRAFSSIPTVQLQVQSDIRRRLSGVPPEVALAVLEDWRRDLWATQSIDPDPGTDQQTTLEVRILRQLQARGIPVNQLNREVQQALEGATLR